jgi:hypothetical protein
LAGDPATHASRSFEREEGSYQAAADVAIQKSSPINSELHPHANALLATGSGLRVFSGWGIGRIADLRPELV